jgi:hypothetical protein
MNRIFYPLWLVLCPTIIYAQILLYANNFENPKETPVPNCGPDLDATLVNTLWGGTGTGTGGGGLFTQRYTVETMLIKGPDKQYADPSGKGGNYCLSMLRDVEDDLLTLTLNTENLSYVNLSFDFSGIDLAGCGGPFGVDVPIMNIKLFNSPDGNFDYADPGNLLDEKNITGIAAQPFIFNWTRVQASLLAGAANNSVTLVFDLTQSGYAAFDNLRIEADNNPLPVLMRNIQVAWKGKHAELSWNTSTEINSSHYDIQRSSDGRQFTKIATVKSNNLPNGSGYAWIDYHTPDATTYYRLAITDFDGSVKHSKVVALVKTAASNDKFRITQNGVVYYSGNIPCDLKVINQSGAVIISQKVQAFGVLNLSYLKPGVYLIQAEGLPAQKFVKF